MKPKWVNAGDVAEPGDYFHPFASLRYGPGVLLNRNPEVYTNWTKATFAGRFELCIINPEHKVYGPIPADKK